MERLKLDRAIWELLGKEKTFKKEGVFMCDNKPAKTLFTVGNFYIEVNVVEVQMRAALTRNGNIFRRIKIRDQEHEAVLVVWGNKYNRRNLDLFSTTHLSPKRIRIKYPVKPFDYYIQKYGVGLWAPQDITVIEDLTKRDHFVFVDEIEEDLGEVEWEDETIDYDENIDYQDYLPHGYEDVLHPEGEVDYDSDYDSGVY